MSAFSSIALPGRIPSSGSGSSISPEKLFGSKEEKDEYRRIVESYGKSIAPDVKIRKVEVRIFDLSDKNQVEEYAKLWKELLEKAARNEVAVESRKDLVHRKDGTSYWMKYVEYVEFGDASEDPEKKSEGGHDGR